MCCSVPCDTHGSDNSPLGGFWSVAAQPWQRGLKGSWMGSSLQWILMMSIRLDFPNPRWPVNFCCQHGDWARKRLDLDPLATCCLSHSYLNVFFQAPGAPVSSGLTPGGSLWLFGSWWVCTPAPSECSCQGTGSCCLMQRQCFVGLHWLHSGGGRNTCQCSQCSFLSPLQFNSGAPFTPGVSQCQTNLRDLHVVSANLPTDWTPGIQAPW